MAKYVQNTYTSDIQIDIRENGRFKKSYVFSRYTTDRFSGQVIADGFTELSDEDYKVLQNDRAFALMVKNGNLVVQDKAPLRAGSFEQMMELRQRITDLEAENRSLREELAKAQGRSAPAEAKEAGKDLDKMTYNELKAYAAELGLEVKPAVKKADLVDMLKAKEGR